MIGYAETFWKILNYEVRLAYIWNLILPLQTIYRYPLEMGIYFFVKLA